MAGITIPPDRGAWLAQDRGARQKKNLAVPGGDAGMTDADAIRRETIRRVLSWLTRHAVDPERIGMRVIFLDYVIRRTFGRVETPKDLARRLNLKLTSVYEAIYEVESL